MDGFDPVVWGRKCLRSGWCDPSSGMRLAAGDPMVFNFVGNLTSILVNAAVNGEGVAWLMLDV